MEKYDKTIYTRRSLLCEKASKSNNSDHTANLEVRCLDSELHMPDRGMRNNSFN